MKKPTIKQLQSEIQHLRSLFVSLSASVLRRAARETEMQGPLSRADAERFMREADECFSCAHIPGLKTDVAQGLEAAGHELWALAVEIETQVQRGERKRDPGQ